MPSKIPCSDLLAELRRLADELDRPPTSTDMQQHGKYSGPTYGNRFGSWADALEAAGLDASHRNNGRIPRQDLTEEIQRLADDLGRPPRRTDLRERGKFSTRPFDREFESWADALKAAGLEPGDRQRQPQNIPREELLDEIRRLANQLLRPPSSREMEAAGRFSTTPYEYRFGSWNDAIRAAGFEPLQPPPSERGEE